MATRSAIIQRLEDGSFWGVYCHWDGQVTGVGATLKEHYMDPGKVAALIYLGEISTLGERVHPEGDSHSYAHPEPGTTVFYGRDRGDSDTSPIQGTLDEVSEGIGHDGHVYLFERYEWTHNGQPF
jgi:predicted RNase H-like HicB family nuclease